MKYCLLVDKYKRDHSENQWLTEGGSLGCSTPPRNSEGPPKLWQTQPDCENLKIAEFGIPTLQDVQKKGSKILKLPRFAIVLR